ncbi:MAG: hypothetical protein RSE35_13175, partial [Bacteroidales bacterium]
ASVPVVFVQCYDSDNEEISALQPVGSFCREGLDKRGKALGLGLGTGILPLLGLLAIKGAKVCSGIQIGSIATISNVEIT